MNRLALPKDLILDPGTTVEQSNNAALWTVNSNCTPVTDNIEKFNGQATIRIEDNATGSSFSTEKIGYNLDFSNMRLIEVPIYIYNKDDLQSVRVDLRCENGYFYYYIPTSGFREGWNKFRIASKNFVISGTPDWNAITKLRIRVESNSGKKAKINFSSFTVNIKSMSKILFGFDDARQNVYDFALPILKAKGYRGTTWAVKDFSTNGNEQTMQENVLKALYFDEGWDVGGHTVSHAGNAETGIDGLTYDELRYQYEGNLEWLLALGFERSAFHVCFPGGRYNDMLFGILRELGIKTGRTTILDHNYPPFLDLYKLRTLAMGMTTTFNDVKPEIDKARWLGSTIDFMLHGVYPQARFNEVPESNRSTTVYAEVFEEVVEYCHETKADVVIKSELFEQFENPRKIVSR